MESKGKMHQQNDEQNNQQNNQQNNRPEKLLNERQQVAELLLAAKAVQLSFNPLFTWASGIKSPIYCDNRLLLSNVISRNIIIKKWLELTQKIKFNAIAGVATAGIPWGSILAHELNLPFIFVRSTSKAHGKQNQIEGHVTKDHQILVIEDLVSTGKSSWQVIKALQDNNLKVSGLSSIFSYELADQEFAKKNINYFNLTSISDLLPISHLSENEKNDVQNFLKSHVSIN